MASNCSIATVTLRDENDSAARSQTVREHQDPVIQQISDPNIFPVSGAFLLCKSGRWMFFHYDSSSEGQFLSRTVFRLNLFMTIYVQRSLICWGLFWWWMFVLCSVEPCGYTRWLNVPDIKKVFRFIYISFQFKWQNIHIDYRSTCETAVFLMFLCSTRFCGVQLIS